jgi:hypothetical protein
VSNFKLTLPTDIPWERICVTEDMIDPRACDPRTPAKWQTSLAAFKYRPDDEDQLFPAYYITYLKVTATITGYQPLDDEIQGKIDWDGVDVTTIPGLKDLLNSYNPCHGAILQVVVTPEGNLQPPLDQYPFFMDFEPKKRELYELATDTKEKQSRSIESLNITKSAGNTQSTEILDVDMGGGGFGMQSTYAGTGGGFNYTAPNGQWGTKQLNSETGLESRSTDVGQERRETYSYSTTLSQMYHLLDSYHLGTNRAVFFVQPRPHTLEEPSGFVRGPRPVEGIQEFFLVVAQPRDQEDFCVSLRLDTSHLTKTPIMDYDRKSMTTSIASANAPVATDHDIPDGTIVGARACFIDCWDVHYHCFRTEDHDSVTFDAPAGYRIEGFNDLINESDHGTTNVVITPNHATLNINVEATGHICYEGSEVCVDCPDTIQAFAGHARRQVQVNLVSTTPTKQVGEEEVLMITTRGLCCCDIDVINEPNDEFVVGFVAIPAELRATSRVKARGAASGAYTTSRMLVAGEPNVAEQEPCEDCGDRAPAQTQPEDPAFAIRQANELSRFIRIETLKSLNDPYAKLTKFVDTDFFAKQLEYQVVRTKRGREKLAAPAARHFAKDAVGRLAKHLGVEPNALTLQDVWSLRSSEVASVAKVSEADVKRLRLSTLGVAEKQVASRSRGARKTGPSAS